ncbi:MAG: GntR family transcriptional regulator [Pseudomonadota bacterium]
MKTSPPKAERAPRAKISDIIVSEIEKSIFNGELLPGTRLHEVDLAQKFKASRTPVREAIQRLTAKDLLSHQGAQGVFVSRMDAETLMHMFEALSEVEGVCARLAARRITKAELAALKQTHEAYSEASKTASAKEYYDQSVIFHEMIGQFSKNTVLVDMTQSLIRKLLPYRQHTLELPSRIDKSVEEHTRVLKALERNDEDEAERLMREHSSIVADSVMHIFSVLDQRMKKES